jgi:hypothetical protein
MMCWASESTLPSRAWEGRHPKCGASPLRRNSSVWWSLPGDAPCHHEHSGEPRRRTSRSASPPQVASSISQQGIPLKFLVYHYSLLKIGISLLHYFLVALKEESKPRHVFLSCFELTSDKG